MIVADNRTEARILVIDDEAGIRDGCQWVLSCLGHVVDTAAGVATGRRLIGTESYDLFLLGTMLLDGCCIDLIEPILERDSFATCIIITGLDSLEMGIEAVQRGAYDFLYKPFTSEELTLVVEKGLERRRLMAFAEQAQELEQAKSELERLNDLKSRLMLKMAHELRAPVAAVQSYIKLILGGYISENELEPSLQRVQDRLQELLDMTGDLLNLAHLEQTRDNPLRTAGIEPIAEVLEETLDMFREQIREKQQILFVDIRDRPMVTARRDHLRQIWTNLISNAIKYTPDGGKIEVTLLAQDSRAIGKVADTGIGIAPEDQEHVFQEFFRTGSAKGSGQIGTGLGLSIVKQIVDIYGGAIKFSSRPGSCTEFTFALPLEPAAQAVSDPDGSFEQSSTRQIR